MKINNITQKLKSLLHQFLELSLIDKIGIIFVNIMLWIIMPIVIYWGAAFTKEIYIAAKNFNHFYEKFIDKDILININQKKLM
jgi:hypothetical protein